MLMIPGRNKPKGFTNITDIVASSEKLLNQHRAIYTIKLREGVLFFPHFPDSKGQIKVV